MYNNNNNNKMTSIVLIDNCIVQKFGNSGISITPIRLYQKLNKVKLELDDMPFVYTGSRKEDAKLMLNLLDSIVSFDSLPINYPLPSNILK